jgi:hypothetical protein
VKVAAFLRSHFEKDPISPHLAPLSDIFIPDVNLGKDRMMEELMLMGGFTDWKCLHRTFFQQIAELQIRFSFYLCSSILLLFWHMKFVPPFVESDSPSFKFDTNSNGVGVEQENRCHG